MPSHEVHEAVKRHIASVMFYAGGEVSELGRSPTRMAEILGCGLPVVANPGVGDVAEIIQKYRVGVLVTEGTPDSMNSAFRELLELMNDPELPGRCRRAAEKVFLFRQAPKPTGSFTGTFFNEGTVVIEVPAYGG